MLSRSSTKYFGKKSMRNLGTIIWNSPLQEIKSIVFLSYFKVSKKKRRADYPCRVRKNDISVVRLANPQ